MNRLSYLFAAKKLGLFTLARWLTRNRLRILGYHGIWFSDGHYGNHLFMSPEKFEARMRWLKTSSYPVIFLDQAIENLYQAKLPPYSTVVTIDDGWYGTYSHMLPALEKYKIPATLYVSTGAVDSQKALPNILLPALIQLTTEAGLTVDNLPFPAGMDHALNTDSEKKECTDNVLNILWNLNDDNIEIYCRTITSKLGFDYDEILRTRQFSFMNYSEISDANSRGLDVQLHTHSHRLDPTIASMVEEEILSNREKLRPYVDSSLEHFCYPGGIHDVGMYEYLENSGVKSATLVDTGLVTAQSNRYEIKRILDGQNVSQLEFEAEMSGFLELVRNFRNIIGV